MRILFLDHPQFTSGSHFLWHGLNENLPAGSVVAYPHIPTHYSADEMNLDDLEWFREMEGYVRNGARPQGIPPFAPGEGLTGGNQKIIKRYEASKKFRPPDNIPSEQYIRDELAAGRFSLIILANSHRVPTIALGRLRDSLGNLPPIVYYDAGERDELNEHWVHAFRPALVFKQILTPSVEARGLSVPIANYKFKLLPLPLSSPILDMDSPMGIPMQWFRKNDDPLDKLFDVFYRMGPTWPGREPVLTMLDALCQEKGLVTTGLATYTNYHVVLSRSRMAVTMRGSGRDTQRYWEIPLYKTLMVSDGTMGCIHPYPFEDGKTAVFYSSINDLRMKLLRYMPRNGPNEAELQAIARAGKDHLWKYHSTGARAVFFLERVREYIGISDAETEAAVERWKRDHKWDSRPWRGPVAGGNL
jgi:hypothetical protein